MIISTSRFVVPCPPVLIYSIERLSFQSHDLGPCDQLVSPEPEITVCERNDEDEFLILACDGIWDVMANDDLCDFVRHQLRIHSNLETVCSNIIDTCLNKVSVMRMSMCKSINDTFMQTIGKHRQHEHCAGRLVRRTASERGRPA